MRKVEGLKVEGRGLKSLGLTKRDNSPAFHLSPSRGGRGMIISLSLTFAILSLSSFAQKQSTKMNDKQIVIYQLLPRLFGNKNTTNTPYGTIEQNGSGKFNDITDKA